MQDSPLSLQHFERLSGPYGLYQHATKREPNLAEGYCVDDNARAVIVLLAYIKQFPLENSKAELLLRSCFTFIQDARYAPGTYYNFRDAKGTWLTHDVSEDMYARLSRMYAYILSHDKNLERQNIASTLLIDLTTKLESLTAPLAQAETIIALTALPKEFLEQHTELEKIIVNHTQRLLTLWNAKSSSSWPWFQDSMTYANALLPHSILLGLAYAPDNAYDCLHASAAFLMHTTSENNIFIPVGNMQWYPKGGTPSRYDQQAIEASTMFDFLLAYHTAFPDKVSDAALVAPYHWFFGKNTKNVVLADSEIGACLDGLNLHEPNPNYGAESMLAYLWAELLMNDFLKS